MTRTTLYRVAELVHLLDGGVWPPQACERVGWTVTAAEKALRRTEHNRWARVLQGHVKRERVAA